MMFCLSTVFVLACVQVVVTAIQPVISTTTMTSVSTTSEHAKKNMAPGDNEHSSATFLPSSFSTMPSFSFARNLLDLESRAEWLEQELEQKSNELEWNVAELDQERQQRQTARQHLQQFEGCARRTSLQDDGNGGSAIQSASTATTTTSVSTTSEHAKKNMVTGDNEYPPPSSSSSVLSTPPSFSFAGELFDFESRAKWLEQELQQKSNELEWNVAELYQERQQRRTARQHLQQFEGCVQRTSLNDGGGVGSATQPATTNTTMTSVSTTSKQVKESKVPGDNEYPPPSSSSSALSIPPSFSFAGELLDLESRAKWLEQKLQQKSNELEWNVAELDQERQQRRTARQLLERFEGCVQRTSLKDGGSGGSSDVLAASSVNGGGNMDDDEPDEFASKTGTQQIRKLFKTARGLVIDRRMVTIKVSNQDQLTNALKDDAKIKFAEDIILSDKVMIDGLVGVVIRGKGFKLNGGGDTSCMVITNGAEITLTNVVVTRGFTASTGTGAGLSVLLYSKLTMKSCVISKCTAFTGNGGAGIYISESNVVMRTCTITENASSQNNEGGGGGLHLSGSSSIVVMYSCTISYNNAPTGAGVMINDGVFRFIGCTFSNNGLGSTQDTGKDITMNGIPYIEFYSLCPGNTAYAGTGSLDCDGCSGPLPADLSDTSSCDTCTAGTPYACCGATVCNALALTCSRTEQKICSDPTLMPTLSPTRFSNNPTPLPTLSPTLFCGAGSFFNQAAGMACTLCPAGTYANITRAPKCRVCAAGTYANKQGMEECESCQQGKLSSSDRRFCEDCSAGRYIKDAKACTVCEAGRYAPQPLTGACLACGAGSFTNNGTAATTCSPCNAGSFSTELTAVACNLCAVGSASASGQTSCILCESGKYAEFQGSSTCTACSAGFAVAVEGASSCNECAAGRFQSRASESSCERCAGGKFTSESASTACSECPRGYSSVDGSSSCDGQAVENFFLYQGVATVCPKNSVCGGGTLMPRPNTGYWVDRRSLDYVGGIYKCPRTTCVLHESQKTTSPRRLTRGADGWSCWHMSAYELDSNGASLCDSDSLLCKEGSRGALCGSCDDDFIYSSADRVCVPCSTFHKRAVLFLLIAGGVVLLGGGIFASSRYAQAMPSRWVKRLWVWGLLDSGDIRVAWANYQIIQSTSWNLAVNFPSPFKDMLNVLSFFSFDFLSLECLFENSDHYLTVFVWSAAPVFLAAFLVLVHVAGGAFTKVTAGTAGSKMANLTFRLLLLCYLVLPSVTLKQFQALDCVTVARKSYLRIDTSIDCNSKEFRSFKTVVYTFLALYLATPLVWFILLFRERVKLCPPKHARDDEHNAHPQEGLDHTLAARDGDASLQPLRFLFSLYHPTYYYLECLEMYRRVLFVGVLPLLSAKSDRRSALGMFFSLCSLAFYGQVSPFLRPSTNILAYVAQYATLLTFGAALAIEVGMDQGVNPFVFGCTLVVINIVVLGLILWASVLKYFRERSMRQWRRPLNTQELAIVNRVMCGRKDGENADRETRSEIALKQSLIDSKHVKMTKQVGAGAFGEVFKGTMMGQPVAVKVMSKITDSSVRAFRNEILLTATLRHPNIVVFVGSCWGNDLMCLLLEWIPRGNLLALLENKTQDLHWDDPLLRLAMDIARGMAYLHGRDYFDELDGEYKRCILHRDLKPENALVTDYTAVKISDFGTSRAKAADDALMTGVGTPLYLAPEIARGDSYDEKADVYSFGMTLIDMASDEFIPNFIGGRWKTAFSKDKVPSHQTVSFNKVLRPIWEGKWSPVSEEVPIEYAPTSVNRLIVRCCSHVPETRPSFTEILDELGGRCFVEIESKVFFRHPETVPPPTGRLIFSGEDRSSDTESAATTIINCRDDAPVDALLDIKKRKKNVSFSEDAVVVEMAVLEEGKGGLRSLSIDEPAALEESTGDMTESVSSSESGSSSTSTQSQTKDTSSASLRPRDSYYQVIKPAKKGPKRKPAGKNSSPSLRVSSKRPPSSALL